MQDPQISSSEFTGAGISFLYPKNRKDQGVGQAPSEDEYPETRAMKRRFILRYRPYQQRKNP